MARPPLSVTIITLNEEQNLPRAIRSVRWADEIVVVDSGSTDKTVEIARQLGARVLLNSWPGYGKQKNFAQASASHDWILNIDADECVSHELRREIETELEKVGSGHSDASGFAMPRRTYYLGRWIRYGGWYPNYLVRLADRRKATWTEPNVHEALVVNGPTLQLKEALDHYSFWEIQDQIVTNLRFSKLGSQDLKRKGQRPSLFKLLLKPIGKFCETYLIKRGFLDGLPGFLIAVNAAYSVFLKYAYLLEPRIQEDPPGEEASPER